MPTISTAPLSNIVEADRSFAAFQATPESEQLSPQQHALLSFGRRTNAQPPLPVLLQDAISLVCEILHARRGGIGEVDGDTLRMSVSAQSKATSATKAVAHQCSLSDVDSMAAYTLRSGNLTVSTDLRRETRFHDTFLSELDVRAALMVPLHVNGKPFGTLGVFADSPRVFSLDDVTFAETIAHLLSASIARIKVEQKLQEVHAIQSSVLGMVDSMVMTLDMNGRVVEMNRACEDLTKYKASDVRDQPFWQSMVSPEEADLVKIIFESSRGSQIPSEFDGEIVSRDGQRKRVSWSLKVLSTGQVQTILMTGRDQSVQTEVKAELDRVRTLAQATSVTLSKLTERLETPSKPAWSVAPAASPAQDFAVNPDELEMAFQPTSEGEGIQQRRSPRRAYRFRQEIAVMNDRQLPAPSEFFEVDFWDLSACGFSFFLDEMPTFETLVAGLGRAPSLSYFSARVMRIARMTQDSETRYLVGCDFITRIHLPKTRI